MSGFGWESSGGGGGSLPSGFLQVAGGVPLDSTLRTITDGLGTASPLQLSTTSVSFGGSTGLNWDNTNKRLGIGTNTPLGILHLKTAAAATRLLLDGDAAQNKIITYRTAGVQRFGLYTNNTAESGANAGSDFAIRAYSDTGTLLSTPIFIKRSTGLVGIGTTAPSARLHVRGDGTNPIARFEDGAGTERLSIPNAGAITANSDITIGANNVFNTGSAGFSGTGSVGALYWAGSGANGRVGVSANGVFIDYAGGSKTNTSGTIALATLTSGFAAAAGSANFRPLNIAYTINNSGAQTGTATGIFLNATETALNGMGHNLMDLQRGGVSQFTVSRTGEIIPNIIYCNNYWGRGPSPITFANFSGLLQIGGVTNAFPAIKRNGAGIDFRLADDSAACEINTGKITMGNINFTPSSFQMDYNCANHNFNNWNGSRMATISGINLSSVFFIIGTTTNNASAIIQADSTTRGFLPPRQTQAQRTTIASPAIGLIVYQTDTVEGLYVFKSTGWTFIA
jgi:hypothetical protein